ncbi:helix-turn-helix domain-containing protein [Streptomyces sp. NPDC002730]|uniref:helix-turn-helix domain-containing protein n=1 Tax=Streptomyces sp. NPDC002730 TaxID=3364662 RepID=UPI00369B28D3
MWLPIRVVAHGGHGGPWPCVATVAARLRRQRMEAARRDLADPALCGTPIHAIAARWGFPRAADFSRAHRTAYGTTPKGYRHLALHNPEEEWTHC